MELADPQVQGVRVRHTGAKWRKTYLREWRDFRGLTQEAACEPMGISHGQLSKIERGLHPYSQKVLEVAARLYGCTVADLLTRQPTDGVELFSIWHRMSPEQRKYAARMLRGLMEPETTRQ